MKRFYILMMLLLTGIMAEAQTSVWDGSRKLWTHGEGTENNPYLIESAENLAFLAYMVDKDFDTHGLYFKLTTDIDLNGSEDQPWIPIGRYDRGYDEDGCDRGNLSSTGYNPFTCFKGHFDGDGHVISNIYVDIANGYCGLFGYANTDYPEDTVVIENVFVKGGTIKGYSCGGIVGKGGVLVVSNCKNTASIEGSDVGGIMAGIGGASKVINCSNTGPLSGSNVGGIVGGNQIRAVVKECFNEGDITANRIGGGIICSSYYSSVLNNFNVIENCYNTGSVSVISDTSTYYPTAGGLLGIASGVFVIKNSYNVGEVSGNHHVGCLVGFANMLENVSVENCYYLDICSESEYGMSKTAEAMREEAFVTTLNQDGVVWGMDEKNVNDGFPILTRTNLSVDDATEVGLRIYPNPTSGILFVETCQGASLQTETYRITNLMGQTVLKGSLNADTQQIDVSRLPNGMYLIRMGGATWKFVVNK